MVQAIIFDCDGVLIDSEVIHVEEERRLLAENGLTFEDTDYSARFMGLGHREFMAALNAESQNRLGVALPDDFSQTLDARAQKRIESELAPIRGIEPILADWSLPKAVASSARLPKLRMKLAITALDAYFGDHIYSADQVANSKPAPDLFLFAAEQLAVRPQNCLVIEDSLNGVRAGVAAGMTVYGFTGGGHVDGAHGDALRSVGAKDVFEDHEALAVSLRTLVR